MKALAVLGTIRSPLLPNVPTMSEAGYPEVNIVPWYGYGALAAHRSRSSTRSWPVSTK
jgi:tripartite-type tricarboxylate transporter receptor subunit TctC